jgi:hypothetical protein
VVEGEKPQNHAHFTKPPPFNVAIPHEGLFVTFNRW